MSTWKTFKLMALVLVAALVLPNVAMAAEGGKAISQESNSYTETENGIEKYVNQISNDVVLVSWENEREMVFEQYDAQGNLIDKVVVNKTNLDTTSTYSFEEGEEFSLSNEGRMEQLAPLETRASSYKLLEILKIVRLKEPVTSKMMSVYEGKSTVGTDYVVPSTAKTVAQLASQLAIGLIVSASAANFAVGALVSWGLCTVVGNVITKLTSVTVRANKTSYSYYGKDRTNFKESSIYQGGNQYTVTSRGKTYNKVYTEGLVYNAGGKFRIANMLCANLYGQEFEYVN